MAVAAQMARTEAVRFVGNPYFTSSAWAYYCLAYSCIDSLRNFDSSVVCTRNFEGFAFLRNCSAYIKEEQRALAR